MSHSHIPVNHLLQQVAAHRARRGQRDRRPPWITRLIGVLAELFEPLVGVGRVGFDCQLLEDSWSIGLYLGRTELVGGRNDGDSRHADFQFDVQDLLSQFTLVEQCVWNARANPPANNDDDAYSTLTVSGLMNDHSVQVHIFSHPPIDAGPGLRQFPNGDLKTV